MHTTAGTHPCVLLAAGLLVVAGIGCAATQGSHASPARLATLDKIARMREAKKPGKAAGKLSRGTLEHAAELAGPDGIGYYMAHPNRGSNFGHDRMVFGLMMLGVYMYESLGDGEHHRLRVHDISARNGGKLPRHINHQMGLDVDLALYATDTEGKHVQTRWAKFDTHGKTSDGERLFDTARNWTMLEGILENEEFGEIRAILLADWLKDALLSHARAKLALVSQDPTAKARMQMLIRRADELIRQPRSSPHADHFHLSLRNE